MKKYINLTAVLLSAMSLLLSGCSDDDADTTVDVTAIHFTNLPGEGDIELIKGETYQLKFRTVPEGGRVRFFNTTSEAFRVNQDTGEITAIAGGFGTVIALAQNGDQWTKAYCTVNVTEYVEEIEVTNSSPYHLIAQGFTLNVRTYFAALPWSATDRTINYFSSDPEIATVNPTTGVVQSVSKGVVEVWAQAMDEGGAVSGRITVYSGYSPVALSKSGWTADASTSQSGYAPRQAIDGSTGTFWHADWDDPEPYPYYLLVDMKSKRDFSQITLYRRSGYSDTRDVEYYISELDDDDLSWDDPSFTKLGQITFGDLPSSTTSMMFRTFPEVATSRYLMIKLPNGNRSLGDQSIAEVTLYNIQ